MIHNRIWGPAVGGSPYYICVGVGRTAYACINILYPMYADVRRCGDTRKNGLTFCILPLLGKNPKDLKEFLNKTFTNRNIYTYILITYGKNNNGRS
jgi:hypothetical protein